MTKDANTLITDHILDDATPSTEARALAALPKSKQEVVLARLDVMDHYLGLEKPSAEDADAAAAQLSMKRRNFYRLLDRLRRHGPVAGLSPGYRTKRRSSAVDGLGDVVDLAMEKFLNDNPLASLGEVTRAVFDACRKEGVSMPSETAIRRRLNALRAIGPPRPKGARRAPKFGRSLLVDQCAISLPMETSRGPEFAVVTFIVDVETRLLLGLGLSDSSKSWAGLRDALEDAEASAHATPVGSFAVAEVIEEIHWVIPDGLDGLAAWWARGREQSHVQGSYSAEGARRHGQRLLKLLGGQFMDYRFLPRLTVAPGVKSMAGLPAPLPAEVARNLIHGAKRDWNYEIVRSKQRAKLMTDTEARRRQLERWRMPDYLIKSIGHQLNGIFKPYIEFIEKPEADALTSR